MLSVNELTFLKLKYKNVFFLCIGILIEKIKILEYYNHKLLFSKINEFNVKNKLQIILKI